MSRLPVQEYLTCWDEQNGMLVRAFIAFPEPRVNGLSSFKGTLGRNTEIWTNLKQNGSMSMLC